MSDLVTLSGSCLCGVCKYSITARILHFFQCHCVQCRKITSSAFAANIITEPAEITWISGEDNVTRFDYPERGFAQVFCKTCGSGLPFMDKSGDMMFIPAGTLDHDLPVTPEANIYWGERAKWYEPGVQAEQKERM